MLARRWLEGVWLMLGGPRCLEVPEALNDVDAFFKLVDKLVIGVAINADKPGGFVGGAFGYAGQRLSRNGAALVRVCQLPSGAWYFSPGTVARISWHPEVKP